MKRFPWHEPHDPVPLESPRTNAAAIHSLADGVRWLEQAGDPGAEDAADVLLRQSSRDHPSVVEDFAEFLSSGSADGSPGEPDRDFKEQLRRRLWRLHVGLRVRRGRTH